MPASALSLPEGLADEVGSLAALFGITGLAIAVVAPGTGSQIVVAGNTSDGAPVDAHTPFSIASAAKHATAVVIVELAQAGKLSLDDAVERWLPALPSAWRGRTLSDLLHHTSGLPDYLTYEGDAAIPASREEFLARYARMTPYFERNEAWCYSNTNYILLGFVVAEASGEPYADALRHRVLDPAGCVEIAAGGPLVPDGASDEVFARIEGDARTRDVVGDGDLVLSATGALGWHRVLSEDVVLNASSRRRLVAPATFTTGRPSAYGCGWFTDELGERACHWHAGHFGGWTAFFYRMPSAGAAVYLMSNVALGHTRTQRFIAQRVLEACAPGTTSLALVPLRDDEPALTHATYHALFRPDGPPDPARFAPEQRLLIERVQGVRSALNLWCGEVPAFELVEETRADTHRFRRYRITYATRVEHVRVGHAPDDTIFWAWPV